MNPDPTPAPAPSAEFAGRRIVVLTGADDDFDGTLYFLKEFFPVWRDMGFHVEVHRGLSDPPPADLAVLHVDVTVIPEPYLALARRYPRTLNLRVRDISKRRVSTGVVRLGDGYEGPVMVKTNLNSAGMMELEHTLRRGGFPRLVHRLRKLLPWYCRDYLRRYRIFERRSEVPALAWINRDLVIERFQPERAGDEYCLRTWFFFGDQESNSLSYADEPVIKGRLVTRRETAVEVPAELRAIRRRLGFDYGKFDYSLIDGRPVLYDANRTPTWGGVSSEALRAKLALMAEGVRAFF